MTATTTSTKASTTMPLLPDIAALAASPPIYRGDRLSDEPRANKHVTDERHFFGFRRRESTPRTPSEHMVHDYVYNDAYNAAVRAFVAGANLLAIGPPGSGKTALGIYLAHNMGLSFYPIPLSAHTQGEDLLGKPAQDDAGIWRFVPSPLANAYINGGLVLLDELPALKPAVAQILHPFLNRDPVILQTDTGETTLYPHDDFRILATGNHWGNSLGNYELGEAMSDRFLFVAAAYLNADAEIDLLSSIAPNVPPGIIGDLVTFANMVRNGVKANPDSNHYCLTTRTLRKLVSAMELAGQSLEDAVEGFIVTPLHIRYRDEYAPVLKILIAHVSLDPARTVVFEQMAV